MTKAIHRRDLLRAAGAAIVASALPAPAIAQGARPKVVVIGGGFGGATAAKYLRLADPRIEVTLVERDASYITCPFSNYVLGGFRKMEEITHKRDGLKKHGVKLVRAEATAIDPDKRQVRLKSGKPLAYDRVIAAPGVDIRFDAVPGYDAKAAERMPHAWKAGAQTLLLKKQLEALPNGGTVIIAAPANPFRCPPGPYERASMIAHYLKTRKPRSKLIILDTKDAFSKQGLFLKGWEELYPGMVEWVSGAAGGKVTRVDAASLTLFTDFGQQKAQVVNFIPPQWAGAIAREAGLADDKGWCAVDPASFESAKIKGVHLIGDAIYAGTMPKSGTAANSQAKVAAQAVADLLAGRPVKEPMLANTCYSLVGPDYGISVTGVYQRTAEGIKDVPNSGGVSPAQASAAIRKQEAVYTEAWYRGIIADSFA